MDQFSGFWLQQNIVSSIQSIRCNEKISFCWCRGTSFATRLGNFWRFLVTQLFHKSSLHFCLLLRLIKTSLFSKKVLWLLLVSELIVLPTELQPLPLVRLSLRTYNLGCFSCENPYTVRLVLPSNLYPKLNISLNCTRIGLAVASRQKTIF